MFEGMKQFEEFTDAEKRQIVNVLDKSRRIAAKRLRKKEKNNIDIVFMI